MATVQLIDHPLVQHKLTLMRRKDASTNSFRQLLHEVSALMAYEVLRDMPMHDIEIVRRYGCALSDRCKQTDDDELNVARR